MQVNMNKKREQMGFAQERKRVKNRQPMIRAFQSHLARVNEVMCERCGFAFLCG